MQWSVSFLLASDVWLFSKLATIVHSCASRGSGHPSADVVSKRRPHPIALLSSSCLQTASYVFNPRLANSMLSAGLVFKSNSRKSRKRGLKVPTKRWRYLSDMTVIVEISTPSSFHSFRFNFTGKHCLNTFPSRLPRIDVDGLRSCLPRRTQHKSARVRPTAPADPKNV